MRTILIYNISLKAFPARPRHQPASRAAATTSQRGQRPAGAAATTGLEGRRPQRGEGVGGVISTDRNVNTAYERGSVPPIPEKIPVSRSLTGMVLPPACPDGAA